MNPPRHPLTPKQQLVAQATTLGLSPVGALQCADLILRGWPDPGDTDQPEADFFVAYAAAKAWSGAFAAAVDAFGAALGVSAASRANGVKGLERLVEKYTVSLLLPLDLLAAKVVVGSLRQLYEVAEQVPDHFRVVAYKDRILAPQKSGYRDVQFIVAVPGTGAPHFAEIKVMHRVFDELDVHEHKLYEIRRGLEAVQRARAVSEDVEGFGEAPFGESPFGSPTLSDIESMVYDQVGKSSKALFARAWKLVVDQEQKNA